MKNVPCVGLCWAMTFGLVAVAIGQQPAPAGGQAPAQPAAHEDLFGAPQAPPAANLHQQPAMPAPGTAQERLDAGVYQAGQAATANGQQRGELGVFLGDSGGPGVVVRRITPGSGAEKAGLRTGDIVLQVNGRGAATPLGTAQMIRQIPIGQSGTLTIWRDGDQQQLQVTMQPARQIAREMSGGNFRDPYQVMFRGEEGAAGGESAARIMRLEQQIATLTQELQQMRQEMAQLRASGGGQSRDLNSESAQGLTPPATIEAAPPAAPSTPPASEVAPPPGFGATEEKKASEPAPAATPPAATPPAPAAAAPATPPPPAAEKSETIDPFGSEPAKTEEKKAEEKPASGAESKDSAADELFK